MNHLFAAVLLTAFLSPAPAQVKIVASPSPAQPMPPGPPENGPVLLDVGKFVWLDLKGAAGPVSWDFSSPGIVLFPEGTGESWGGLKQGGTVPAWHKAPSATASPCLGVSEGAVTISAWGVVDGRAKRLDQLTIQVGPRPPPPDPKPPEPKPPQPVTSFRVFLIFESGKNITPAEHAVMTGNVVEEWLNTNCTGGTKGWRRRDQSLGGELDTQMSRLWAAIQPRITSLPAVAIEINDRIEILPLEPSPAAMVATFDKYKKGVK